MLQAPQDARCLAMDVAFLSDEFPDFVGGSYNDAFTAQLGSADMWVVDGAVDAPGNFARDSQGNPLTVNAVFDLQESTASTYDGATARLRSASPVLGGREVSVFLTIQDLGDSVLDSAAFIDNVFFSEDALCRFGSSEDSDGDGLLDEWEENGFAMTVGGEQWSVDLPAMGADPLSKEYGWRSGPQHAARIVAGLPDARSDGAARSTPWTAPRLLRGYRPCSRGTKPGSAAAHPAPPHARGAAPIRR